MRLRTITSSELDSDNFGCEGGLTTGVGFLGVGGFATDVGGFLGVGSLATGVGGLGLDGFAAGVGCLAIGLISAFLNEREL